VEERLVSPTQEKTAFDDVDANAAAYRSSPTNVTAQSLLSTLQGGVPSAQTDLKDHLLVGKSAAERKTYPLREGLFGYFYNALVRVANVSFKGNEQHNPGQPLHWARGKSKDQLDCALRHIGEYDPQDFSAESEEALSAAAWRVLAELEIYLERKYGLRPPINARSDD
jgi:hypothetical protein